MGLIWGQHEGKMGPNSSNWVSNKPVVELPGAKMGQDEPNSQNAVQMSQDEFSRQPLGRVDRRSSNMPAGGLPEGQDGPKTGQDELPGSFSAE